MSDAGTTRRPPEIVFVPPSERPPISRYVFVILVVAVALTIVGAMLAARSSRQPVVFAGLVLMVIVSASAFAMLMLWMRNRSHWTQRRRFLEKRPLDEADQLAKALSAVWKEAGRVPKLKDVRDVLKAEAETGESRARIICFGEAEVPEVGDLHFEPEILTPTGALGKQLGGLVIALVLVSVYVLDYLGLLPAPVQGIRHFAGAFGYFVVTGLVVLAMWIWRGMIRPKYVRMAPGVIQVLEYRYSKSKPTIRGYPMEAGTLVLFVRAGRHAVLTLARDDAKDVIAFSRMRRSKEVIERAWQALLSTAPTPPLSDEELVG